MAEKIFNTRLLLKTDTLENWSKSSLKLKNGEVAIATVAASAGTGLEEPVCMIKIGTAEEKTFAELPWALHAKAADVLTACKTEDGLKAFVNAVIADAGIASNDAMEALAGRVTTAEGKITTLEGTVGNAESGLVKGVADNAAAITTLNGLVGDKKVATQISEAIAALDLANTYEAKGEAAKVQTALDTYKTANDKAVADNKVAIETEAATARAAEKANADAITAIKDGTTIDSFADVETALAGKETAGAAAQALADAKAYADGLADNYDEKGAAATAESNAKAYAKEYADGLAGNYDAAGSASTAEANAKAYTDAEITEWVGTKTVGTQITEAITALDLANTYDAKGAAAAVDGKLTAHVTEAEGKYETKTDASAKLTEAKGYTDTEVAKVQGEVDALELYVGTIPTDATATTVVDYIDAKTANIASDATVKAIGDRVKAIEDDYLKKADKDELAEDIADLNELVGTTKVADQISTAVAAEAEIARAAEKANADDIDALEGRMTTAEGAIATLNGNSSVDGSVDKKIADAFNDFATKVSDDKVVNTYKELIDYAATHGEEFTELVGEVDANTKAIETLNGDSTVTGSVDKKIADAIAAENLGQYATDDELATLAGRVTTAEGEIDTLQSDLDTAELAIDALEEKVGDKAVSEQIADYVEENNILGVLTGEGAPTIAAEIGQMYVDTSVSPKRYYVYEGFHMSDGVTRVEDWRQLAERNDIAGLNNKISELWGAVGEDDYAGTLFERVIALEEDKADSADLAAIATSGNVNDLIQTAGDVLIFDCGTSAV